MYYDNKRTFYMKQYGPTVAISVIAVALISVGTLFYLKSKNPNTDIAVSNPQDEIVDVATDKDTPKEEQVILPQNNISNTNEQLQEKEQEKEQEIVKTEETEALKEVEVVPYFKELEKLVISEEVNVTSVDEKGNISLEYNGDKITVTMIGISYKYSTDATYNKIKSDLENKKVKVAFDTEREIAGITYAYVYLDNELYNATLLKSGLATLKSERTNVALATKLSEAQANARDNKLGVWNR